MGATMISLTQFVVAVYVCNYLFTPVTVAWRSYLSASFPSPPNATTVLTPDRTSSAMPPADAYALCSRTVNVVMI